VSHQNYSEPLLFAAEGRYAAPASFGHKRNHAQQQNAAYSIISPAVASSVGESAIRIRIYLYVAMDIHKYHDDNAIAMLAET